MINELLFLTKQLYSEHIEEGFIIKEARHHACDGHWELMIIKHENCLKIENELQYIADALVAYDKKGFVIDYAEKIGHKSLSCWKIRIHNIERDRKPGDDVLPQPQLDSKEIAAQEILNEDVDVKEEDDGVCSERQD